MSAPTGQQAPTLWHVCNAWLRRATVVIAESADALERHERVPGLRRRHRLQPQAHPRRHRPGRARRRPAPTSTPRPSWTPSSRPPSCRPTATRARSSPRCSPASAAASSTTTRPCGPCRPAALVAVLLRTVATAARRAVARPVAGTILTVADDAASAAELRGLRRSPTTRSRWPQRPRPGPASPWPGRRTSSRCWRTPGWSTPGVRPTPAARRAGRGAWADRPPRPWSTPIRSHGHGDRSTPRSAGVRGDVRRCAAPPATALDGLRQRAVRARS